MGMSFTEGDIFVAEAQVIGIGLNAAGHSEVTPFFTALADRYPVFVSEYRRRGRAQTLTPGDLWLWRDSQPWLMGMIVRDIPQGATRLRYVEAAVLNLYKNWEIEGVRSLAIMRLAEGAEWLPARGILEYYLGNIPLPVMVFESYLPHSAG